MAEEKPAFKISILASGRSGNSLYIESEKKRLLVDAGLSGKKITSLMAQIDRTPDQLDGILVTHEHRDHASQVFHLIGPVSDQLDGIDLGSDGTTDWKCTSGTKTSI